MVFRKLLSAVATKLSGMYRVDLHRQPDGLSLQVFRGQNAIPMSRAATKFETLAPFVRLPARPDGSVVLTPAWLSDAKMMLRRLSEDDHLTVVISPDVDALQLAEVPAGFRVTHKWDPAIHSIVAQATLDAFYLGDGWFADANRYWHVHDTVPQDDLWLRMRTIERRDIVVFVAQVAPNWQQRRLPYHCEVRLEQAPALSVTVQDVVDDAIELDIAWRVPTDDVHAIPSLPGYVIASSTLMPGIPPQVLSRSLGTLNGVIRLTGQQIPRFMHDTWPAILPFAGGSVQQLLKAHAIVDRKCELVLEIRSELRTGIGAVTAVPVVSLGESRIDAAELSQNLDIPDDYVRTHAGWLPRVAATELGITSDPQLLDGTPLTPINVSPTEVLRRGSERLEGPWSRIEVPFTSMPQGHSPEETTTLHVDFLRAWRVPGGIVSTAADVRRVFAESIASAVTESPSAKVLIVGTREVLSSLEPVWSRVQALRLDGLKKDPVIPTGFRGLVAASPRALDTAPELLRVHWSIVCLLEADTLVRSSNSKLFTNLRACRKSLVVGLFSGIDFLQRTSVWEAIAQIFHVNTLEVAEVFARYGLRDPKQPPPALPRPYHMHRRASGQREKAVPAEIRLFGPSASGGLSIPRGPSGAPSSRTEPAVTPRALSVNIEIQRMAYGATTSGQKFVADGRRLSGHREKRAVFVPFLCYWPTYDSMNAAQQQWYFYWRGQVRAAQFIDTDLSYIFVHVYELLNNVGVASASDGYGQLWRLWMSYRERYPRLDLYLADWLTDYLLASRSGPLVMKAHIQSLPAGARIRDPDLLLGYLLDGSPLHIPTVLIEALSDHRITSSTFYRNGHRDLVDEVFPQVLQRVNSHMLSATGKGVFDTLKPPTAEVVRRDLFRSAVYGSSPSPVVTTTVAHYCRHLPLRAFLTALFKHTENRLRELKGFEGRLRSSPLDPAIQTVIDEFLGIPVKAPSRVAMPRIGTGTLASPPRVIIDMDKAEEVAKESDEIRVMLLGNVASADLPDAEHPVVDVEAVVAPPQVVINMDKVNVLERESAEVRRILLDGMGVVDEADVEGAQATPGASAHQVDPQDALPGGPSAPTSGEPQPAETKATLLGLPTEWASFASALTIDQREILRAILELSDPMSKLRVIADRSGTMPSLLIDSINEHALDTLGDYIIVPDSKPPTIEEGNRDMLEAFVGGQAPTASRN